MKPILLAAAAAIMLSPSIVLAEAGGGNGGSPHWPTSVVISKYSPACVPGSAINSRLPVQRCPHQALSRNRDQTYLAQQSAANR